MIIENSFTTVLTNQRKGALLTDLSRALQEATQSVREHKKQAVITLKITIAPANGDASVVQVCDDITVKVPKKESQSTIFYPTDENTLSRKDPNQQEMELVAVPTAKVTPLEAPKAATA